MSNTNSGSVDPYIKTLQDWRDDMEVKLRAEEGWLTVVGLYWLNEGENTVGSDPANAVVLPAEAPAQLGVITLTDGQTHLRVTGSAPVIVDGAEVMSAELKNDHADGGPTRVTVGRVTFTIIKREDMMGVRVRDANSDARQSFSGRHWYPIDPAYHVTAQFQPHDSPLIMEVENSIGRLTPMESIGTIRFDLNGQPIQLTVFESDPNKIWLIFRDTTSGQTTYPAGRFLVAPLNGDGTVDLDFNRTYSPPCAFTDYATCPFPPPENRLTVAIPAGEKYAKHE